MRSSAPFVEATADAIRAAGTPLRVRTTVLPGRCDQLPPITDYICQRLRPAAITVEPIYAGGRANATDCATLDDVGPMVDAFLAAEAVARSHGVALTTTGSRPGEIHGPYCNIFRDVLNLVPGGAATACFKTQSASDTLERRVRIGAPDATRTSFALDARRITRLRDELDSWPDCARCFNRFHCVRTCPDRCPVDGPPSSDSFRCRFQRTLTTRRLRQLADGLNEREEGAIAL
jgi:hypothetical protein